MITLRQIEQFLGSAGTWANLCRTGVTLLLTLTAAYLMSELTWKLLETSRDVSSFQTARIKDIPAAAMEGAVRQRFEPRSLVLFGSAKPQEITGERTSRQDIPQTTLDLVLKGIISARPMQRAIAIIEQKGKEGEEEIYFVGDEVPGGALVREIFTDRIILLRSGKLETLMIEEKDMPATSEVSYAAPDKSIVSRGDGVHYQIDRSYLNSQLSNLAGLAREVGLDVYRQGSVQKGYRLISSRGSKMLNSLGLQPGDVLEEVNGVQLNNASQGLMAYQKLKNSSEVKLLVNRNGVKKVIIYSIN